jgi:short-subunit dehydrogenase
MGPLVAAAFAQAGARPALVARSAEDLAAAAERCDGDAYVADLTNTDELRTLVARVEADGGPVDVVVNNAGVETAGALASQSAEEVDQLLRLNLAAPAELCRQVLPGMIARGSGHLVFVSSLAAVASVPGLAVYGASKAGLTRLAGGLRADLKGSGVSVTDVQLGPVSGDMVARATAYPPTGQSFARLRRIRLLSDLDPADVAAAMVAAVQQDRRHLRLPRRAAVAGAWAETPQQAVDLLLAGRPRGGRR